MKISEVLMLLGGLALFLYGMHQMSNGLESAAGNKMKTILEKLTSNRFIGVLVGALITAVIQSSSATTVMVVGFVNSGLMTLNQAVWVIMGANIGTTITGQLIALDISKIAPLIAFIGVVIIMFVKNQKAKYYGEIITGLGILFIGMEMMGNSMNSLQSSPQFTEIISNFKNPLIGILAGAIFTAIIQSSSASVGILQAMAGNHIIGLSSAVYVLFGQNIGTCITAVIAAIGAKRNAKRTTIIHLMFNIIGTILFTTICLVTPFVAIMEHFTPNNPIAQIANVHTVFNIVTTLLLLPFGNLMAKISMKILPGSEKEEEKVRKLQFITSSDYTKGYLIGKTSVLLSQIENEVTRMLNFVKENVESSFNAVIQNDMEHFEKIVEQEEYIDYLNAEISKYIGKLVVIDMSEEDSKNITGFYSIVGNLERIADHAMNIAGYSKDLKERGLSLSQEAIEEVKNMKKITKETLDATFDLKQTIINEQCIDDMNVLYRKQQLVRMHDRICSAETGILYSEMLTDFERIGDHSLNIAEKYSEMCL